MKEILRVNGAIKVLQGKLELLDVGSGRHHTPNTVHAWPYQHDHSLFNFRPFGSGSWLVKGWARDSAEKVRLAHDMGIYNTNSSYKSGLNIQLGRQG